MPVVVDLELDGTPDVIIVTSVGFGQGESAYLRALNGSTGNYEPRNDAAEVRLGEVGNFATQLNSLSGQALIEFLNTDLDVECFIDYQAIQSVIIDGDSVVGASAGTPVVRSFCCRTCSRPRASCWASGRS